MRVIYLTISILMTGLISPHLWAETTAPEGSHAGSGPTTTCRVQLTTTEKAVLHNSDSNAKVRRFYKKGETLTVDQFSGDWIKISWSNGAGSGWLPKSAFDPQDIQAAKNSCLGKRASYPSRGDYDGTGSLEGDISRPSSLISENGLSRHYETLKKFYAAKKRTERYAFVNRPVRGGRMFMTYVVDMKTGRVEDTFQSLMGYNGMGCGTGQTRPGIFRLSGASGIGASRKEHWGNGFRYQVIQNIGGHTKEWGGRGCGQTVQHVAHSNKRMSGRSSNGQRYSAGCFVTSPEKFTQWTQGVAGDALIYNVPEF